MQIHYKDGLLLVDITITYKGKRKVINNMVLDTGAVKTLVSQDIVEDIDIHVDLYDQIVTYFGIGGKEHAFRKQVECIQIGNFTAEKPEIDFNDFGYKDINGLLGLDLLMKAGFTIDLSKLKMHF